MFTEKKNSFICRDLYFQTSFAHRHFCPTHLKKVYSRTEKTEKNPELN